MIRAAALLLAALPLSVRAQSPPSLSEIAARSEASGSAVITWTTDQAADAEVDYGLTAAYGNTASAAGPPTTSHAVTLSGLAAGSLYHYRVKSRSTDGISSITGDFTFTAGPPAPDIPAPAAAAPSVLIMNPPEALVSGVMTVSANANAGRASRACSSCSTAAISSPWPPALHLQLEHRVHPRRHARPRRRAATSPALRDVAIIPVTVDNLPPIISEVSAAAVSSNGAIILWKTTARGLKWTTDDPDYGQTTALDASASSTAASAERADPATLYHYRVRSRDAAGLLSVSWNNILFTAGDPGDVSIFPGGAAETGPAAARAPQRILTPARADGINDRAVFGPEAREVSIVDLRGRRVFHETSAGAAIVWNCRDASGSVVPSGIYIAAIVTRDSKRFYQSFSVAK